MAEHYTVGIDVGGTKFATALVDAEGNVVASLRGATSYDMGVDAWVASVKEAVACLTGGASSDSIGAVGLGFAGQIDPATGTVHHSPNIGWRNVPLRAILEEALRLPVVVTNDVQSATWAEWKRGAGQGTTHMVCVFVGTGVGGGIIFDGKLYKGAAGSAGEIGHTIIDLHGSPCKCGSNGCLEAFIGGWAIAQRAQGAVQADRRQGKALLDLAGGDLDAITGETLSQAFHQGDAFAASLVERIGEDLGAGLTNLANLLNPELIVLGGGVIQGTPELLSIGEGVMRRRAIASAVADLRVTQAQLGAYAPVIGAALLAREAAR